MTGLFERLTKVTLARPVADTIPSSAIGLRLPRHCSSDHWTLAPLRHGHAGVRLGPKPVPLLHEPWLRHCRLVMISIRKARTTTCLTYAQDSFTRKPHLNGV